MASYVASQLLTYCVATDLGRSQFFSPGDGITACVGLLALAIQSAFSMGLHRDPQRLGAPAIDFLEAESRR